MMSQAMTQMAHKLQEKSVLCDVFLPAIELYTDNIYIYNSIYYRYIYILIIIIIRNHTSLHRTQMIRIHDMRYCLKKTCDYGIWITHFDHR